MSVHDLLLAPFSYEFMRRGLLSAVLLGASGGLLGCVLVLRRLALMGDALSHSLLPGVAVAWLLFGTSTSALFFGGLVAGLLTALGSALLSRLTRVKEDAAFGSLFIVFFGMGVALISKLPTRINLADFLFGNVLGVGASDLRLAGAVSAGTVALFAIFYRSILLETFDPVFHRATGGRGGLVHLGFLTLTVLNLVAAMQLAKQVGAKIIGIVGKDSLGGWLEKTVEGKTTAGRRIVVRHLRWSEDLAQCHVLFVPEGEMGNAAPLARLKSRPVLTVGESAGFARHHGIINFVIEADRVRFEINPDAGGGPNVLALRTGTEIALPALVARLTSATSARCVATIARTAAAATSGVRAMSASVAATEAMV